MTQDPSMKISAELDKDDIDRALTAYVEAMVPVPPGHRAVIEHKLSKIEVLFVRSEGEPEIARTVAKAGRVSTRLGEGDAVLPKVKTAELQKALEKGSPAEAPAEAPGSPVEAASDDRGVDSDGSQESLQESPQAAQDAPPQGNIFASLTQPSNQKEEEPAQAPTGTTQPKPLFSLG